MGAGASTGRKKKEKRKSSYSATEPHTPTSTCRLTNTHAAFLAARKPARRKSSDPTKRVQQSNNFDGMDSGISEAVLARPAEPAEAKEGAGAERRLSAKGPGYK